MRRPTSLTVTVTADAPPLQLPVTRPASIDVTRQVLGDDHLAGVALGTSDIEAERSLVARFGQPGAATEWRDGCVGQNRILRWGPLVVGFQRPEIDAAGRFDSYSYQTDDRGWPLVADPTVPDTVMGLGTAQSITLGSTVAELRGATDDPTDIRTGYLDVLGERWVRRDGEVVVGLDRDFLRPDALVVRISAPRSTSLVTC